MPSLSTYKHILELTGKTSGQAKKYDSDLIMEVTWDDDIQSKVCYLYDYYHDDEFDIEYDLCSNKSKTKVPIDVKFIEVSYNTMDKDQVAYHIQFKPSQECNVDYYEKMFKQKYHSRFPLGLYIDIPDNKSRYQRWLIVDRGNVHQNQFDSWFVLPCDYKFQWVYNGKKYQMWGVLRSQNSYNSGIWTDYKVTSVEDQQKFIVPLNPDSEILYHNQRMIIDAPVETEPVAWLISKIKRFAPNGINRLTLAQDKFNQHTDFIEKDKDGNVIGMWADYFTEPIQALPNTSAPIYSEISFNGIKPVLKIGGTRRVFTVIFYDTDKNIVDYQLGNWEIYFTNTTLDNSLFTITTPDLDSTLQENQIAVLFTGDDTYTGELVIIKHINDTFETSVTMEIESL